MNSSNATKRRKKGKGFKPKEPYTNRLRKILDEYPDGSQVLREILQNSDDSKSTEQIFILDHNTYPSNSLLEPEEDSYERTNLKLDRYQGPALLAKNNTIFEERDFESLLKLADSEKQDQFDKIGVMGVGFNSIYHITDSPSFITGENYVILDPHEWYFDGGVKFNFVDDNLAEEYPDQFAPFGIPCDRSFKGTLFRYPLRTDEDSIDSKISDKVYKPDEILEMFHKFYEKESVNCLLFLKYIERIQFYELKEGATEPELLYTIQLENIDDHIRQQRRLIVEKIVPMMKSLKLGELNGNNQLDTSYVASFSRKRKDDSIEISSWLILNYLDDLLEVEKYFYENFNKYIGDYKFIPNVGLAVPLNNPDAVGRLFCFLPLPIDMPFLVSVHGYFAVSTNRRTLWSPADNEDLAVDALARLKVEWNKYLFEKVLPKAWAKFLNELPLKVSNLRSGDLHKFWPRDNEGTSSISSFCKDLLQNVIENLNIDDRVFRGPPSSNTIGVVSKASADSYDTPLFQESEFHWLSLLNGYLEDEKSRIYELPKIIGSIGFPFISTLPTILNALKKSTKHEDSLHFFTPATIRNYLRCNSDRWQEGVISRKEILYLFEYILEDKKFDELEGFKMIPLADGTLGTLTQSGNSYAYIGPDEILKTHKNDECNIFKDQLNKFIDKSINNYTLYHCLHENAKAKWILNIKILDEFAVGDMIRYSLNYTENTQDSEEIPMPNNYEWIYQLWDNLKFRNWDLTKFEDIHLIPTNHSTLRKLKTPRKTFSGKNISNNSLISIFEKFGAVFVDSEFDRQISEWNKISPYIIKPDNIISVLDSFRANASYPDNLKINLQSSEATALVEHLSNYLRLANKSNLIRNHIDVIKHLPIFIEVDHTSPIPLLPLQPENKSWYLLPREEEKSYGKIIYPSDKGGFINTISQNMCYILEDIIKIPRLTVNDYWRRYVIPFLESQIPGDIDIVVDKLFDRLTSLLDVDASLKDDLGRRSFVPVGTIRMSQQQQTPNVIILAKPMELFDPKAKTVTDLFFEDEQLFPAGRYGSPQKYLPNLKLLGIKSVLTPNDIISRIDAIIKRRETTNEELVRIKADRLLKYIDDKWDQITKNSNASLEALLEKEWIPTVDESGKKFFSKPRECYGKKYKYLVCLAAPVLEYNLRNRNLLKYLKWDTCPDVGIVLKQLEFCRSDVNNKRPPKELRSICNAIYEYMNEAFQANDETSKERFNFINKSLKNESWILCGDKFRSSDKVVINLPNRFQDNDSLIVKLPMEYYRFKDLFKHMGVRDEIGVKDLVNFIKNMVKEDKNRALDTHEVDSVIMILEQIARIRKDNRREGNENDTEELEGLLIPSDKNVLVDFHEIHFDDMEGRLNGLNELNEYSIKHIAHYNITSDIATKLEIQTLIGEIYGNSDWEIFEQDESLTTRIKNILKDYWMGYLFREFLQNADDAKAEHFLVIIDERQFNFPNKEFISKKMEDWQGPAIWIYNSAVFSSVAPNDDFKSLRNLGIGGKSNDDTKIGKFGIGFNCAYHFTDLPSVLSGQYIAFLDPHAKYLPPTGFPLKRPKGTRFDFVAKNLKENCPDQCYPYEAIFNFIKNKFPDKYKTGGCDFSGEFEGTLFRLPLRTHKLAKDSDISTKVISTHKVMELFSNIQDNNEMLFLRNIESCGLYRMKGRKPELLWEEEITTKEHRQFRRKVIDKEQIYQLNIDKSNYVQNKKVSEIWAVCTGGHNKVKPESRELEGKLKKFSEEKRLKPRGGVAALLAQSNEKTLKELRDDSFPNPPDLIGKIYSYLSLSITSNLGVHLNGDFSLSSARSGVLQSDNEFLLADCDDAKWNKYIMHDVLSDLHVKLIEYIVELEEARYKETKKKTDFISHTMNNLWPIPARENSIMAYKSYGLNVIRKLGLKSKIFWTGVNQGQFISLKDARIFEKEKAIIVDMLVKSGISAVKLDKDKIEQLDEIKSMNNPRFPYEPINGKLICNELQMRKFKLPSFNTDDSLFQLLDFILQDKSSFKNLAGLPLVPLNDGSVGKFGEVYYIGKDKHLKLFPKSGTSKFISIELPENLKKIFNDDEFISCTNIKKFDASVVVDLLMDELQLVKELEWDPDGESIPNKIWLDKIWSILNKSAEKLDFNELSRYPLLPMVNPSNMLIRLDMDDPLLHIPENGHVLYPTLVKLEVRFTNMSFHENAHENLQKCVEKYTPINIINALKRACASSFSDMEQLFYKNDLEDVDYEKLRAFIKAEIDTLIEHGQKDRSFMDTLKSLPIWPMHSSENRFNDAISGNLLTYKLPFFSFNQDTNFYRCNNESDFNVLTKLGANPVDELEYIRHYIVPVLTTQFPEPSEEYINFLQSVLSLRNREIEQCLRLYQAVPNQPGTEQSVSSLVRADTLYDANNPLFRRIFANTDKFLPPELQNNPACLEALGRMGLKREVDYDKFVECALEIESQKSQIQYNMFQENVVKDRAKFLVRYLYEHTNSLNFNTEQWNKILGIKFVPSEKNHQNIQNQFYQGQKETSGFESFEDLCSHKYKKICWTQCPLFDDDVEPTTSFSEKHSEIGFPTTENIIDHLFAIVAMSKEKKWSKDNKRELKNVINEIYEILNKLCKNKSHILLIKTKIGPKKEILLNGDDPFDEKSDEKSWVAGGELILGIQEDIKVGMYKVNNCLIDYEELLIILGARTIRPPPVPVPAPDPDDQKEVVLKSLLDKLISQSDIECQCNDVVFVVGEEKVKIGASRYVLSAVSKHFKKMFCGGLRESTMRDVEIPLEEFEPDTFWILLQWLYGQSFEDAAKSVLCKRENFTSEEESYESYYLTSLLNLLKISDYHGVKLKDEVESKIINGSYISIINVCECLVWSKDSKATRLRDYCKKYIKSNWELVLEQKLEYRANASDIQEEEDQTRMLELLLSDDH
ncbi:uncharacterized protein OCT59_027473 [Rhizophagus irregularis]|nr:hypothetical protein OCT59_027473 [Rhizophagus irregularis]GBC44951.1 hypothetical protein GLOIN_2v552263 [Rhizophagus irregularis DAOM 181602=DAOM 197198]CAB4479085.1 unnamed protein product [Rhizophagus irregularis]CAG8545043.1 5354_t:CDS:10 [Rhizophagus irregularis]